LLPEAIGVLRELLRASEAPPQARISAARVVLDHAARSWNLSKELEPYDERWLDENGS
jgi:hypothetical protein